MSLAQNLTLFNAKERFHLLTYISGKPVIELDRTVCTEIASFFNIPLGWKVTFSAFDYHLDWLFASLHCFENAGLNGF